MFTNKLSKVLAISILSVSTISWASTKADALSWNWSYTDSIGDSASGTFNSDGTSYNTTEVYTISSIAGSYTPSGGAADPITGLSKLGAASQEFKWDGTSNSPILVNYDGFAYITQSGFRSNQYENSHLNRNDFLPADKTARATPSCSSLISGCGSYLSITTTSLTPQTSQNVPAPSILAGSAFAGPLLLGLRYLKKKRA